MGLDKTEVPMTVFVKNGTLTSYKVDSKVKQKQRSWWQVQHETPKSGPVFIVKVVDSVVIEANLFYKSSSISSKYYFYSIKRSFQQSKKDFVENGQFQ